jgi:general secretion pathway protein G
MLRDVDKLKCRPAAFGFARRRAVRVRPGKKERKRLHGFTLLELMIVISIITILLSIVIPMCNQSILRARERALRSDLRLLNSMIVDYTLDKQKAPQSLDDLVTAKYVEKVPNDPMTGEPNWEVEQDDVLLTIEQQEPGITGVHSASNTIGSNGEPYSSW